MAVPILTENSILVYDFAHLRGQILFEQTILVHLYTCARSLSAYFLGKTVQKNTPKTLDCSVNTNHSMHRCRMELESFKILPWALVFGQLF